MSRTVIVVLIYYRHKHIDPYTLKILTSECGVKYTKNKYKLKLRNQIKRWAHKNLI
jgi:hypothetical protein